VLEYQEKDLKGLDIHSTESVEEAPFQESEKVIRGAGDITNLIISDEDNPELPALTFRFWVLVLG
jgi:hypothetical protein